MKTSSFHDIQMDMKQTLKQHTRFGRDGSVSIRPLVREMQQVLELEAYLLNCSNYLRCLDDVMAYLSNSVRGWVQASWTKKSLHGVMFSQLQERPVFGDAGKVSFAKLLTHLSSSRNVGVTVIFPDDDEQSGAQKRHILEQHLNLLAQEAQRLESIVNSSITCVTKQYEHDENEDLEEGQCVLPISERSVDGSMDDLNAYISEAHERVIVSEARVRQKEIVFVRNSAPPGRLYFRERCIFEDMTSADQGAEALDHADAVITYRMRLDLVDLVIRLCPCIPRLIIMTDKLEDRVLQSCAQARLFGVSRFQFQTRERSSIYVPVYKWLCVDSDITRNFVESTWDSVRTYAHLGTSKAKTITRGWEAFLDVWVTLSRNVLRCNLISLPNTVAMAAAFMNCRTESDVRALDAFETDSREAYMSHAMDLDEYPMDQDTNFVGTNTFAANALLRSRTEYFQNTKDATIHGDNNERITDKKRKRNMMREDYA